MNERVEIDGRTYADSKVLPSHGLDVAFSQKTRIMCLQTRARFEDKGWSTCLYYIQVTKVILVFVFSLVASLTFIKHNPYLFIDCSIENGFAVVYWRGGEW